MMFLKINVKSKAYLDKHRFHKLELDHQHNQIHHWLEQGYHKFSFVGLLRKLHYMCSNHLILHQLLLIKQKKIIDKNSNIR